MTKPIWILAVNLAMQVMSARQTVIGFRQTTVTIYAKLKDVPVTSLLTMSCSARCQANKATCAIFQINGGVCRIEDYSLDASHTVEIDTPVFLRPG